MRSLIIYSLHQMLLTVHVAGKVIREMHIQVSSRKLKGIYHSEDIGVDGRISLAWILE